MTYPRPEDFDEKVRALRNVARPPQDVLRDPSPPPPPDDGRYDFLRLGEEIATSLVESAEAQVTQAQNMLEHTKAFAENVRAQITNKAKELHDMNEKLRAFGSTILDAHNKFHTPPTNGKVT
jgi:hypothetical protein